MAEPSRHVTSRDVARLLDALEGEDVEAQCNALRDLCPCRNRRYDREVWRRIFEVYERTEVRAVRDGAFHAIETLRGRVRTDPRSQELVRWLADQNLADPLGLEMEIPRWQPRPAPGKGSLPPIPRWERGRRSRANKRR